MRDVHIRLQIAAPRLDRGAPIPQISFGKLPGVGGVWQLRLPATDDQAFRKRMNEVRQRCGSGLRRDPRKSPRPIKHIDCENVRRSCYRQMCATMSIRAVNKVPTPAPQYLLMCWHPLAYEPEARDRRGDLRWSHRMCWSDGEPARPHGLTRRYPVTDHGASGRRVREQLGNFADITGSGDKSFCGNSAVALYP